MKRILFTLLTLTLGISSLHADDKTEKPAPGADKPVAKLPLNLANGVVLLSESRPVFIRVVTEVDGKPLGKVWFGFIKELFAYLDIDKDGSLNKREVERIPDPNQLFGGAIGVLQGRGSASARGSAKGEPDTFTKIDVNKDGKVDVTEFAVHYRKLGLTPFQFKLNGGGASAGMMAMAAYGGGGKPEPGVEAVKKESFRLFDVNKDGKLSLEELTQAPTRAATLDENEDEMIIPQEIAPKGIPKFNPFGGLDLSRKKNKPEDDILIPVFRIKNNPQKFLAMLIRQYGTPEDIKRLEESQPKPAPPDTKPAVEERPIEKEPAPDKGGEPKKSDPANGDKGEERPPKPAENKDVKTTEAAEEKPVDKPEVKKEPPEAATPPAEEKPPVKKKPKPLKVKFTQKQLGLDNRLFKKLDTNKDKVIDEKEILLIATRRQPDLAVTVRVSKDGESSVAIRNPEKRPKVGRVSNDNSKAMLDLGTARVELRGGGDPTPPNPFEYVIRTQVTTQIKRADKNKDKVIDEKEAKESFFLNNGIFAQIDRDDDKKVTLEEMNQYLEDIEELGAKARQACVTLALSNESRGLFTLFDSNSDRRLSVRELRQGGKLFKEFVREGKSSLSHEDIPQMHQILVRLGNSSAGLNERNAFLALYTRQKPMSYDSYTSGPRWFKKMDRNYDGDVSRKEFLFSKADFAKVDADGDGLISVEEANNASGK